MECGRLRDLGEAAAGLRLGLYIDPPSSRFRREGNDWVVGVLGAAEGEPLGVAATLGEAVELSFLPLKRYVRQALPGEFAAAPVTDHQQPEDGFATGLVPFTELIARAAEEGCGVWFEPPWPACSRPSEYWVIGLLGDGAGGPLAVGRSFIDAVVSAFPPFSKYVRTGELASIWVSGDGTARRVNDPSSRPD